MLIGVSTNNKNKKKDNTGSRKFEKHWVKWASLSQGFSVPLKCGYLSPSWQTKRYQLTGKWFKVSTGMKGLSGLVTQKNSQEEKSASLAFKSLKKPPLLKFLLKWLEIHLGFQVYFFFSFLSRFSHLFSLKPCVNLPSRHEQPATSPYIPECSPETPQSKGIFPQATLSATRKSKVQS